MTDRGLLGVVRGRSQQLFGGVERSNVPRDKDRLAAEVYDGGHAHSVRVQLSRLPLKFLRSLQQVLVLLAVELWEEVKGDDWARGRRREGMNSSALDLYKSQSVTFNSFI